MNACDRVYAVLNHEIPDFCPVLVRSMNPKIINAFLDDFEVNEEDVCYYWRDLTPLIGMKIDAFDFGIPLKNKDWKSLPNGNKVDIFGRVHERGAYTDGYFKNRELWMERIPLELSNLDDPKEFKKMQDLANGRIVPFYNMRGYFEACCEGMSLASFGKAQRKDIAFVDEVISRIEKSTLECAKLGVDAGVEFFSVADDMGYKNGPVTSVKFYEEHIFPRYHRLCDLIHKHGGKIYLHSEGNITQLMHGIIDAGFDGVQGLTDQDGVNLGEIKENFGSKIALLGGFAHSPLLDMDSICDVQNTIKRVYSIAGKNGGLMMGPSAAIDQNCKLENVLAMINCIHDCKY
jgi:hypothetical protein